MGFLSALSDFKNWAIDAIPKAIGANRDLREEMRKIVGDLADELTRGLTLVSMRLSALRRVEDDGEFHQYLEESRGKIFDSFSEFRVCADIRNLEDRFKRVFDPTRAAVDMGSLTEVQQLIAELENHEKLVFDMIETPWGRILQAAQEGRSRAEIDGRIDDALAECERMRAEVKRLARRIIEIL